MREELEQSEERMSWAQVLGLIGLGLVLFMLFGVMPEAQAYVAPRPTVEQVKLFKCWAEYDRCPSSIENEANVWLKSIQPSGRILKRKLEVTSRHIVLAVFYELPDWRTKPEPQKKLPAEAP